MPINNNIYGLLNYDELQKSIALDKKNSFLHQIGEQPYYIEIWLYNQIEGQDPFAVPFYLVDSLVIEESLMTWVVKGHITINNDFSVLEKYYPNQKKAPFIFRTDGRNRLSVTITPIVKYSEDISLFDGSNSRISNEKEFLKKWQMSFDCVIYDVEDLKTPNAQIKKKKLYFHDERYQIFLEKNIEWSTAKEGLEYDNELNTNSNKPSELNIDSDRCVSTSIAIKSIIKTASKNPTDQIKIGFDSNGSIDKPNQYLYNFDIEWIPSTNENKIFYTSPSYSNVMDDLNYILPYCGNEKDGPAFLRIGRTEIDKRWKLFSLRTFFKKSREDQVERLFINDNVTAVERLFINDNVTAVENNVGTKPYIPRAFPDTGNDVRNFISSRASLIYSYRFCPMVASDDCKVVNSPLHTFDFASGGFNIEFDGNLASDVVNNFEDLAKSGLYNFTGERTDKSQILLNINKTKQEGLSVKNTFNPNQHFPKSCVKNKMIQDVLFLNEAITFVTNGLTIRAPGRFVFIDKMDSSEEDAFDDRFLGQWLITKVVHVFTQNSYTSEVLATKVDSFSEIWPKEENKY